MDLKVTFHENSNQPFNNSKSKNPYKNLERKKMYPSGMSLCTVHCTVFPQKNLNLRIKTAILDVTVYCSVYSTHCVYVCTVCMYSMSGSRTRHNLLYSLQPGQARFLRGDSEYFAWSVVHPSRLA